MVYLEAQLCWRPDPCLLILKPATAGGNSDGELGLGDTENRGDNSDGMQSEVCDSVDFEWVCSYIDGVDEMGDLLPAVSLGTDLTATAIASGSEHSCALLSDGQLKCWGGCHAPPFPSRYPA